MSHVALRTLLPSVVALLAVSSNFVCAQTYDTIVNNGDSSNRVDMIFIGDGYTSSEINSTFLTHINSTLSHFFNNQASSPLNRYQSFFNVHRVNVISNESGADKPLDNIFVDTALDASYSWGGNVERCLYFDTSKANNAVATAFAGSGIDTNDGMLLGVINDSKYGGCGGSWGVYAGANSSASEIAVHEIGHSFARLADEYFYTNDDYTGSEPSNWNLTTDPNLGKWDRWLGYNDPDSDIGVIDYYEGGGYHATGLYRPSDNSKMRALGRPFDAISREKFINDIYDEVDPLDAFLDNSTTLFDPIDLWVDTVDPNVIEVEWFVDGVSKGYLGESVDLQMLGLGTGQYEVTAVAFDEILLHANTGSSLDWWRLDGAKLQQSVSWSIVSAIPEPASGWMVLAAGICLFKRRRR